MQVEVKGKSPSKYIITRESGEVYMVIEEGGKPFMEKITFDGDVYTSKDIKEMLEAINILARECNKLQSNLSAEGISCGINTDGNEFVENALEWA